MTLSIARSSNEQDVQREQSISSQSPRRVAKRRFGTLEAEDAVGQFSFGPATQTTVVTTTTTTTTSFPPFVVRSSRRKHGSDTKYYPLANAPTPKSLKKIVFDHGGRQVIFQEAPDATLALEEAIEEQKRLKYNDGTIKQIQRSNSPFVQEIFDQTRPTSKPMSDEPASPCSIDEEMEDLADGSPFRIAERTQNRPTGRQTNIGERNVRSHPRLSDIQIPSPLTPHTSERTRGARQSRRVQRQQQQQTSNVQPLLPSPDGDQQSTIAARRGCSPLVRQTSFEDEIAARTSIGRAAASRASHETTVPTPPVEPEEASSTSRLANGRALSSIPPRLHVSDSPSTQDGNLPSPSLSPVTAAANAQLSGYFNDADSDFQSPRARSISGDEDMYDMTPSHVRFGSPATTDANRTVPLGSPVADIPAMIDYFEALPDELKSYVMHQLLRRCPKSTLHVIADSVNPALKCDFLTVLPPELGLNILCYLDVKSLCKASQVSKKWRQMINSDERAWKELFDADGYTLPQGELQKAITQGWGWQDPYGIEGFEQDLSRPHSVRDESDAGSPGPSSTTPRKSTGSALRRSKRKAAGSLLSSRNKQLKRQDQSREASAEFDSVDWMAQMSTAEGPYNAANAAIMAVPNPSLATPSLKGLHLYKSLYRRHHLIRRNWMHEETKPRHIAFRAHDSHVVTCLQFDTDKILTGSDDNNINVYDTQTGALRKLLRGHEGGVWALQYEGNTLVSGSTDRSVRVWNIQDGVETHVFRGHTSTVRCLQIVMPVKVGETAEGKPIMMPKRPLIITGSRDSTLRVWYLPRPTDPTYIQAESDADTDDNQWFIRTLSGHQHSVRAIAAHADTLVSGSYDCTVRVWKISTGETVHRLQGHSQKVYSVVLDHSRNRCISGSMDNLVKIWSLDTGSALYTLEGHSSLVGLLDLSCDRLVSAAADSTLRIWDPENGQCKATLSAHTGAITCFQHDGQKVVSGSDRTLKMWNIKTGECMKDLLSDLSGVWQVKFNERRCVAAVQRDNMTYIEVLDYGASRDGIPDYQRGRRIVVDANGVEVEPEPESDIY